LQGDALNRSRIATVICAAAAEDVDVHGSTSDEGRWRIEVFAVGEKCVQLPVAEVVGVLDEHADERKLIQKSDELRRELIVLWIDHRHIPARGEPLAQRSLLRQLELGS
jgi:hypothetical protein